MIWVQNESVYNMFFVLYNNFLVQEVNIGQTTRHVESCLAVNNNHITIIAQDLQKYNLHISDSFFFW